MFILPLGKWMAMVVKKKKKEKKTSVLATVKMCCIQTTNMWEIYGEEFVMLIECFPSTSRWDLVRFHRVTNV